jgi:hypothetical protein
VRQLKRNHSGLCNGASPWCHDQELFPSAPRAVSTLWCCRSDYRPVPCGPLICCVLIVSPSGPICQPPSLKPWDLEGQALQPSRLRSASLMNTSYPVVGRLGNRYLYSSCAGVDRRRLNACAIYICHVIRVRIVGLVDTN